MKHQFTVTVDVEPKDVETTVQFSYPDGSYGWKVLRRGILRSIKRSGTGKVLLGVVETHRDDSKNIEPVFKNFDLDTALRNSGGEIEILS